MNIESFENWLVQSEGKTSKTAYSYKTSIPQLQNHYSSLVGSKIDFFSLSIDQLNLINEVYSLNGDQATYGNKSNGTYRNALNALLKFMVSGNNTILRSISASDLFKIVDHDAVDITYTYIKENNTELKPSTKFNVIINEEEFPPKDFLRTLAKLKGYHIIESGFFGGKANKPFQDLDYNIIDKTSNSVTIDKDIFKKFWIRYKEYFRLPDAEQPEKYKWSVLKQVYAKWDWNSPNKAKMFIESFDVIGSKNLWESGNFYAIAHTKWMFEKFEKETIEIFNQLFDENQPLINRIKDFTDFYDEKLIELDKLLPEKKIGNHYHGDLRAIALYLSLEYPDKYFLFKFNMVNDFCLKFEIPKIKPGKKENLEKYINISNLLLNLIKEDDQFVKEYRIFTNKEEIFSDDYLHLLTQDFIYTVAKYFNDEVNYWRIGSSDDSNSYYNQMLNNSYVAIGWNAIGDLKNQNIKNKKQIIQLLDDKKQIFKADNVRSRKAGEIFNFYRVAQEGDIIALMDGNSVLAIGKLTDDYSFDNSLPFAHNRSIKWIEKGIVNFSISDGSRTTFYPLTKKETIKKINELMKNSSENIHNNNTPQKKKLLNQILYGPPGTGKTYKTKELAINIILGKEKRDRKEIISLYEQLQKNHQIVFTSFHQSISYEDFIEGIKPNLNDDEGEINYEIQDGLFKNVCVKALSEYYKSDISNKSNENVQRLNLFDDAWNNLLEEVEDKLEQSEKLILKTLTDKDITIFSITDKGNLIVKPGNEDRNSRDYIVSYNRLKKLFEAYSDLSVIKNIDREFRQIIGGSNSTAYWSVLKYINNWVDEYKNEEPLKKESVELNENIVKFQNEIVRENQNQNIAQYVIIIDEINRGNISSIFGELITLIEEDKRLGKKESILVNLPYSKKEKFGVPPNLHVIGTMNTADRSVEALDTALRRRFSFIEVAPNTSIIKEEHPTAGILLDTLDLCKMLDKINDRIELLINKDHKIGHSYLIKITTLSGLKKVFTHKIIPLLEEYFYGDFGKIGLVLGSQFVIKIEDKAKAEFADFNYDDKQSFREKLIYKFTKSEEWTKQSFISIYNPSILKHSEQE